MYNLSLQQKICKQKLSARHLIYFIAFLFTLHTTPAVYVTSSFIGQYLPEDKIGYIYSIASLLTILVFVVIRPILVRYGNYKTFIFTLATNLVMLGVILIPDINSKIILGAIIINSIMHATAYFHLDIFISHYSNFKDTGVVRGAFLTAQNIAFVIGPLLAGAMLKGDDYWKIFLFGICLMIPTIYISLRYLKDFKDPEYKDPELLKTAIKVLRNKDVYNAISIQGLLRVFYSWMIIYTPIFLTMHIGFSISETATIIGIALVAFLFFTTPLGYISDKVMGEKELLILGFLIMALSTGLMSFVDTKSFWLWAGILFVTRIGASMVELMGEAYFFKKIDSTDISMVSFYRMVRPITYLIFPAIASGLLIFIDIKYLFLILGIFMLYGIKYSLAIKDTC